MRNHFHAILITSLLITTACGKLKAPSGDVNTSATSNGTTSDQAVTLPVTTTLYQGSDGLAAQPIRNFEMQWTNAKSQLFAKGLVTNININATRTIFQYRLTGLSVAGTNCTRGQLSQVSATIEAFKKGASTPTLSQALVLNQSQNVDESSYNYQLVLRVNNNGDCQNLNIQGSLSYSDGSILN